MKTLRRTKGLSLTGSPFLRKQLWLFIVSLFLFSPTYVLSQRLGQLYEIGIIPPFSRRENCITVK